MNLGTSQREACEFDGFFIMDVKLCLLQVATCNKQQLWVLMYPLTDFPSGTSSGKQTNKQTINCNLLDVMTQAVPYSVLYQRASAVKARDMHH